MAALTELKKKLRPGQAYHREDLARWSNAVDRHLKQLVSEGRLEKVSGGVYMVPRDTRFGKAPARPEKLVEAFLRDDKFLMISPNAYNALGVGTTQLYNVPVVYNRKRHGLFELDGQTYDFRRRAGFPAKVTAEFLLVDLLHNLESLPENADEVLPRALRKAREMNPARLSKAVRDFNSARARRRLEPVLAA